MANRARDILIRFLGDDKGLKKTTDSVDKNVGNVAKSFNAVSTAVKGLVAAGAIRVLQGMAEAAAAEATEQTKLANVLINTTGATQDQIDAVEKWIVSMQMATNVADTELRQALQSLTVAGMSVADAQDAISVAIDVAAAKGINLTSVTNGFVKAQLGNVAGLQRLGIETKNAAGETLTFDQILQGAAETMGGTARRAAFDLAGQMEQVDIAFSEVQEKPGAFAVAMSRLKQGALLAVEWLGDMNNELPEARTLLNELVNQGVDPFTDKVPAMTAVLGELVRDGFDNVTDATEFLQVALGTTTQDMLMARGGIITNGEAWGYTAEQIRIMVAALDEAIGQHDPAVLASERWRVAQQDAAGATRDFTAALQEQRTAMREATDPVFANAQAETRLATAHDKYTRAVIESGEGSEEANTALEGLLTATRDAEEANAALADSFSGTTLTALQQWGADMGVNNEALATWINLQREAAGLPPLALPGLPSADSDRRALTDLSRGLTRFGRETVS